jgi:acyl-CoA thioesterase
MADDGKPSSRATAAAAATSPSSPDAVGAAMYARDYAAHALGIVLDEIGEMHATMSMTVRRDMLNGHAICHGGLIFTLADTAFAYACNAENHAAVALGCDVSFAAPAYEGERLTATARRRVQQGRTGIYDVEVANASGQVIALFRGTSYRINKAVIETGAPPR